MKAEAIFLTQLNKFLLCKLCLLP